MWTIFHYYLARLGGQVAGWGLGLFILGWPIISAYDVVKREQKKLEDVARSFAPLIAAMGGDLSNLASPANYLSMRYFTFMSLIMGFYAVLGGSGLIISDEENGRLDLILAHPVSRTALFAGRLMAFVVATAMILAIAWLGLCVPSQWTLLKDQVSWAALALPFLGLLAILLLFGTLALLLSVVLPSRRYAMTAGIMLLVGGFFVAFLSRIDQGLAPVARLSPFNYFQSGDAINGLNWEWIAGQEAIALLFAVTAWWCFECRDIRVTGEGSWRWPFWRRG